VIQVGVFTDALMSSSACLRRSAGKPVVACRRLAFENAFAALNRREAFVEEGRVLSSKNKLKPLLH
jgi:hypothetical protein